MAMDYTQYTTARNTFAANPGLCNLFKLLSIETWKRIEYAYLKPRMKVFETTITQNIVFTINAFNDIYRLNIDIYEALNERANGNDLELIIRYPAEGVEYYAPIQAKKLYKGSKKYDSMDHGDQIGSLINYANKNKAKPFYLLYNYAMPPVENQTQFGDDIELYGCTVIDAQYLYDNYYDPTRKKCRKPLLYDLNPTPAFPWHELVCPNNSVMLRKKLQSLNVLPVLSTTGVETLDLALTNDNYSGFFKLGTYSTNDNWIDVREIESRIEEFPEFRGLIEKGRYYTIDSSFQYTDSGKKKQRTYPSFEPKSRIVLTKES